MRRFGGVPPFSLRTLLAFKETMILKAGKRKKCGKTIAEVFPA
jgi:hypothetical protein